MPLLQNSASSKTWLHLSLTTSQNATAPKQNFSNPYDYNKKTGMGDKRDSRRVVLNLRYRDDGVPYEDIESRIKYESEKLRIKEVLVVDRNGAVRRYKNS